MGGESMIRLIASYFRMQGFRGFMTSTPMGDSRFSRMMSDSSADKFVQRYTMLVRCQRCRDANILPCPHLVGRDSAWRSNRSGGSEVTKFMYGSDSKSYAREMLAELGGSARAVFNKDSLMEFKNTPGAMLETWFPVSAPLVWVFFDPTPGPTSDAACVAITWRFVQRTRRHEYCVALVSSASFKDQSSTGDQVAWTIECIIQLMHCSWAKRARFLIYIELNSSFFWPVNIENEFAIRILPHDCHPRTTR